MSDVAWIALIIVVYLAFIKPFMQGAVGARDKGGQQVNTQHRKPGTNEKKAPKDGDYVDYEEIK